MFDKRRTVNLRKSSGEPVAPLIGPRHPFLLEEIIVPKFLAVWPKVRV